MNQKQRYERQKITRNKTSNEYQLYWKKHLQKNPVYFRIYADLKLIKKLIILV